MATEAFFDTHCHIQSVGLTTGERSTRELWAKDAGLTIEQVITNAVELGVDRMICVGCDQADSELAIKVANEHDATWASIGLHPHEAQHYVGNRDKLDAFATLVSQPKVVAIGECGFDFFYNHSPKEAQIEVLRFQLELAQTHNLPLIFHVREAFDDFWPIFDSYKGLRGVLHSFTDSIEHMEQAVQRGLYIGVNGIATFAKSPEQLAMYKAVPGDHLVLETDAPFLTPTPFRGTINEPKRVVNIADFVADLRGVSRETLSAVTTSNARTLLGV
jgi:TatD DNase family protein